MKVSWTIWLLLGLLLTPSLASRANSAVKDFIRNKRMHPTKSLRANVSKYLKKMSPKKRRLIRQKMIKKRLHYTRAGKHSNLRHSKNFGQIQRDREMDIHRKMSRFEQNQKVKKRELKRIKLQRQKAKKRHAEIIKKKKEKRNLDELKKRMARKHKGKTLRENRYPISRAKQTKLITQTKKASIKTRFLKSKKPAVVVKKEKPLPRDLDDDVKLSDHSGLKQPTQTKRYAITPSTVTLSSPVETRQKPINPDAIKIDRKLLEIGVSDYADFSPKNTYATQQMCQMQQKQAVLVAREIVTQQSRKLYEKLTNYLLKGKLLVNMTKQKVNKALAGKLKELLKPGAVGFSMSDIEDVEHEFQNPMDEDLSEAEDYVTKETYENKDFDEGMPDDDKIKWNLD